MHPLLEFAPPLPLLAFDLEEFLRSAFQILVLVFFFGAPLLRRADKGGDKGRAQTRRAAPAPRRRSEAEQRGEDLWRKLLEGQGEPPVPQPAQRPRPVPVPVPAPTGTQERSEPRPIDIELAPDELTDIDFNEIDEEALERAPEKAHPVTPEGQPVASAVGGGANAGITAGAADAASEALERGSMRSRGEAFDLPRDAAQWRRAVLLAELLAPPVALRAQRETVLPGRPLGLS